MSNQLPTYQDFPVRYDLKIAQGSEFLRTLAMYYRDDNGERYLLDTTGYSVRWQIRATTAASAKVFDGSTGNGRAVVGIQGTAPNQWNLLLRIPASQTQQFPPGLFAVWDLELIPPGAPDSTLRLLEGVAEISGEVTR